MSDMKISFVSAGYCTHPEKVAYTSGGWQSIVFPASVAVIEHPREGVILFDTGYSERFFSATQSFPNRLYRWITPVFLDEGRTAKAQLKKFGIAATDVRQVILSHFHADHVGGVADFPRARYVYQHSAYEGLRELSTFAALRKAFLPALLPNDFLERSEPVLDNQFGSSIKELSMFAGSLDLLGDGSLFLVPLPGHAEGHIGLFVRTSAKDYLLAGDACYVKDNFIKDQPSSQITRLILDDFNEYRETLHKLHEMNRRHPLTRIVPCHCSSTLAELPAFGKENVV